MVYSTDQVNDFVREYVRITTKTMPEIEEVWLFGYLFFLDRMNSSIVETHARRHANTTKHRVLVPGQSTLSDVRAVQPTEPSLLSIRNLLSVAAHPFRSMRGVYSPQTAFPRRDDNRFGADLVLDATGGHPYCVMGLAYYGYLLASGTPGVATWTPMG